MNDRTKYNPETQSSTPEWIADAESRDGYERACTECGIAPQTDAEIREQSYGLEYARFSRDEWQARSRDSRVQFKLNQSRLRGIQEEKRKRTQQRLAELEAQAQVVCDCGHSVTQSHVMSTSTGTSCADCYDRMSGD